MTLLSCWNRAVRHAGVVAMAVLGLLVLGASHASAQISTPVSCDLYASTSGSDGSGDGSLGSPFRSAQQLVDSLGPGQTGCLESGTYRFSPQLVFRHGGSAGAPVVLSSAPGQSAQLAGGFVYVPSGSDYVTIENLRIDTAQASQVGVQVMASHVSLLDNDITNESTGHQCVILGSNVGWGRAVDPVIEGNVVHQCGSPADGNQDHAIYFDNSLDGVVKNNVIWGAAAFALHLYQNAQGNTITHNVIVDNGYGVIFAGSGGVESDNNTVAYNVIADSTVGYGAQSWWGGSVGHGNQFDHNCMFNNAAGNLDTGAGGFSAQSNTDANPQFVNPSSHNYQLANQSPCLSVVGYDTAAVVGHGHGGSPGASVARSGGRHHHRGGHHRRRSHRRRSHRQHRLHRHQRHGIAVF